MKHTALPWAFTTNNYEPWISSDTEEGGLICPKPENEANAEFIVRACNCHEELIATNKAMMAILEQVDFGALPIDYDSIPWDKWEQALANATK